MGFTLTVKHESQWTFETCATAGGSYGEALAVGAAGGSITLNDPAKKATDLYYGGIGAGIGVGVKFSLGKVRIVSPKDSGAIAPASFPSKGLVLVTSSCPGEELKRNDFSGGCAFVEAAFGAGVGYSTTALLAGMQGSTNFWEQVAGSVLPPASLYFTVMSARAIIFMEGLNVGVQLGGSDIAYFGLII